MNTQIYLMLVRKVNPNLPAPAKAAAMLKNFIMGDSLDAPFLKFIKVQSVSHSIEFGGEQSVTERHGKIAKTYKTDTGSSAGDYSQSRTRDHKWLAGRTVTYDRWGNKLHSGGGRDDRTYARNTGFTGGFKGLVSTFKNNQYVNINLPDHDDFTFTKLVDNATPQLAYGASAQEPFYFAAFFFRRRIGAGIDGMRMPFMGIALRKCLITSWSLDDETEKISLKYKHICWGTFDQVADINAPTGMSQRVWNTESNEGGEKPLGYVLQALVGGLTVAASAGLSAALGGVGGDEVTEG